MPPDPDARVKQGGPMTIKEVAVELNEREYDSVIRRGEPEKWRNAGIVVLYGHSDDLAEFTGAIDDEVGCYNGGTLYLHRGSPLNEWDTRESYGTVGLDKAKQQCATIEALWCPKDEPDSPSWAYRTTLPHATFNIVEEGEVYCRGIVFRLADLPVLSL